MFTTNNKEKFEILKQVVYEAISKLLIFLSMIVTSPKVVKWEFCFNCFHEVVVNVKQVPKWKPNIYFALFTYHIMIILTTWNCVLAVSLAAFLSMELAVMTSFSNCWYNGLVRQIFVKSGARLSSMERVCAVNLGALGHDTIFVVESLGDYCV